LVSNIWSVLGIAPTSDIPAIRRAYAEKLRGIDQEKDAAGFMGLRNAFTTALRMSGQASAPPLVLAPDTPRPPPNPDQSADDARIAAAFAAFNAAEAARDTAAARAAYQHLRALGAGGGPGAVSPLTIRLAALAADDASMPPAAVERLLQEIGLDAMALDRAKSLSGMSRLTDLLNARTAAETWLDALQKRAATGRWAKANRRDRYGYEVARFITGRRRIQFGTHPAVLRRELDRFDKHRRFLAGRLDVVRLDAARARVGKFPYKFNRKYAGIVLWGIILAAAALRAILDPSPN
jgi:hypothetical protein